MLARVAVILFVLSTPQLFHRPPHPLPHHLPILKGFRHTRHCRHTKTARHTGRPLEDAIALAHPLSSPLATVIAFPPTCTRITPSTAAAFRRSSDRRPTCWPCPTRA